ncbi:MAG: single-stranded-DNA-specific exonuclease RecJ [Lachnospiraceae bacterium]|nr:single-stranded-DNA-specific exonuclease RecJ [Lachnospiraceae bacterium]
MKEKWMLRTKKADFNEIGKKFKIDPLLARLIRNRDIVLEEDIEKYLYGTKENMYSPYFLKDMEKAVSILEEKIAGNKKIRIISDYDVDGVISNYVLYRGLQEIGANVDYEIPDRINDGYGINERMVIKAKEDGIDTILTCDNGIAAVNQVALAKESGITVIITDHHDVPFVMQEGAKIEQLPNADAIVNPKQEDCKYPFEKICGATVAYKLIQALYEKRGLEHDFYLEYLAIATVCDVVDLTDENRIIVKEGLKRLNATKNPGIKALLKENFKEEIELNAYHLGFIIGPCINAAGRLEHAGEGLSLLLAKEEKSAAEMASHLKMLNDERKALTEKGVEKAIELVENTKIKEDKVLVVYLEECHESLAGIIAGRIREKYNKPVIVLTRSKEGAKGSGRSIEEYSMFEKLNECKEYLDKFGGHPMAAGLSLKEENIEAFRKSLNDKSGLCEEDFTKKIYIDIKMPFYYISEYIIEQLELLEPFGKANEKPVFAESDVKVIEARILGENKNVLKLKLATDSSSMIEGICFKNTMEELLKQIEEKHGVDELDKVFEGRENDLRLRIIYYPSINNYRGRKTLQVVINNFELM